MEKLLKKNAVCELLGGISTATLYRWVRNGDVPPLRKLNPNGDNTWTTSEIKGVQDSLEVADAYANCGTDAGEQDAA